MKKLIIIGNGDQSRVIQSILLNQKKYKLTHILTINKHKRIKDKYLPKVKVIQNLNSIKDISKYYFICSISNNYERDKFVKNFEKINKSLKWASISPVSAKISKFSVINPGTVIGENVFIGPETTIGSHCFINNNSKIEHHNNFKSFTSTGPSVVTGGNVKVLKYSYLGINSTVIHNITINENVVIGAKALVLKNCKSNSVYYGVPAKKKSKRNKNKKYL